MRFRAPWIALALVVLIVATATPAAALGNPSLSPSSCVAGKLKCVSKKKSCLLGCWKKATSHTVPVDTTCLAKCKDKFDGGATPAKGCFAKLEAKVPNDCGGSVGDSAATEAKVDAFVQDLVAGLGTGSTALTQKCAAAKLRCAIKYDACLLGLFSKAAKGGGVIDAGKLQKCRDALSNCFAKAEATPPCLTENDLVTIRKQDDAFIDDVVAELATGPNDLNNRRCTNNTSIACTSNAPCTGGGGTCEYWFGSYMPVGIGGVAICLSNQWNGTINGTFDQAAGSIDGTASLISRTYSGITLANPCPRCVNDPFPNDGVAGGICSGGTRNTLGCDGNGQTVEPAFGTTSLDCPPSGVAFGVRTISSAFTTGTSTGTVTAGSPVCNGSPGDLCLCAACSGDLTRPCTSEADCIGFGVCSLSGAGEPRKPNSCLDLTFPPADGTICGATATGEGQCPEGPINQHCVIDSFRSCTNATEMIDCTAPGDSCGPGQLRMCYPGYNGAIGDTVVMTGAADPPRNHASAPALASVFCIPATTSAAVNAVYGLPGPGRLRLGGVATDDGSGLCPTQASFLPSTKRGALDEGWTGIAHDLPWVSQGKVTVNVFGCSGSPPNCLCSFTGPVANPNANP